MVPGGPGLTVSIVLLLAGVLLLAVGVRQLVIATVAPNRSRELLDRAATWLSDHNRVIVIGMSAVFGTWFVIKGLSGLGVV